MLRYNRRKDLEAKLRAERPQPSAELLASIEDRVRFERQRSGGRRLRLAFVGGLTAAKMPLGTDGHAPGTVLQTPAHCGRTTTSRFQPHVAEQNGSERETRSLAAGNRSSVQQCGVGRLDPASS